MLLAVLLAGGIGGGLYVGLRKPGVAVTAKRAFDRRCRGGCTLPLLSILPTGALPSLVATGQLSTALGGTITTTRASNKSCTQTNGTLTTLGSNVPCVEAKGLLVENAATNYALQSGTLNNASWTAYNATVSSSATNAPWGAAAWNILSTGASAQIYMTSAAAATAAGYTASIYARATTSTESVQVNLYDTNGLFSPTWAATHAYSLNTTVTPVAAGPRYYKVTSAGTSAGSEPVWCTTPACTVSDGTVVWTEQGLIQPCSTGTVVVGTAWTRVGCTTAAALESSQVAALYFYADMTNTGGTAIASGAQLEASPGKTSYIPTTGATASRAADQINAGPVLLRALNSWCHSADIIPETLDSTNNQAGVFIMNSASASDQLHCEINTAAHFACGYYNGAAGGGPVVSTAPAFSVGVKRHVFDSYDGATWRACVDGVCNTWSGSFTVAQLSETNMMFGTDTFGNAGFSGWISNIAIGTSPTACQ